MLGFPDSEAVTVITIVSSFIVGLGLIVGLFTRLAAFLMAAFFGLIALLAIFGYGWYGAILYVPRVGGFCRLLCLSVLHESSGHRLSMGEPWP